MTMTFDNTVKIFIIYAIVLVLIRKNLSKTIHNKQDSNDVSNGQTDVETNETRSVHLKNSDTIPRNVVQQNLNETGRFNSNRSATTVSNVGKNSTSFDRALNDDRKSQATRDVGFASSDGDELKLNKKRSTIFDLTTSASNLDLNAIRNGKMKIKSSSTDVDDNSDIVAHDLVLDGKTSDVAKKIELPADVDRNLNITIDSSKKFDPVVTEKFEFDSTDKNFNVTENVNYDSEFSDSEKKIDSASKLDGKKEKIPSDTSKENPVHISEWNNFESDEDISEDFGVTYGSAQAKLAKEITCYSCSSEQNECLFVDEKTQTCSTHHGCLYIIESAEKVTRHCFVPIPEHGIVSLEQVCKNLHDVYYECRSCRTDYCNDKFHDRFAPFSSRKHPNALLADNIRMNGTVEEDKSRGENLVAALYLPFAFVVVHRMN